MQFTPPPNSSDQASSDDSSRHMTSKSDGAQEVATPQDQADSRQQAARSVLPRSPRATKSTTLLLVEYPELAAVLAAWPALPDTVRANVVAIVNAAFEPDESALVRFVTPLTNQRRKTVAAGTALGAGLVEKRDAHRNTDSRRRFR
jgi:hypothetical protein